ncbi:hypothetical protein [Streptomyces sp. NPDC002922]|uniref:hypothetical protein n=1 Tax=Streptomyces sp. NPDC002922 TaxID=3154439 RepID=UPI0033BA19F1
MTGGTLAGSASRGIDIPDEIPRGPLREWLEWLRELRRCAGTPALTSVVKKAEERGDKVSASTISRLMRGETVSDAAGQAVAYALAEMDRRPTKRHTREEWDTFDATLVEMLGRVSDSHLEAGQGPLTGESEASREAQVKELHASAVATDQVSPRMPTGDVELLPIRATRAPRPWDQEALEPRFIGVPAYRAITVCAAGNAAQAWSHYEPLADLHRLTADGMFVPHYVNEAPGRAFPGIGLGSQQSERLDVLFAFFHAFRDVYVDERGFSFAQERTQFLNLNDLLPRFRRGVVLIDSVPVSRLSMVEHVGPLLEDALEEDGDRVLLILGHGRWPSVVDRLYRAVTTSPPRMNIGAMDGFEILSVAAHELEEESDDFAVVEAGRRVLRTQIP